MLEPDFVASTQRRAAAEPAAMAAIIREMARGAGTPIAKATRLGADEIRRLQATA